MWIWITIWGYSLSFQKKVPLVFLTRHVCWWQILSAFVYFQSPNIIFFLFVLERKLCWIYDPWLKVFALSTLNMFVPCPSGLHYFHKASVINLMGGSFVSVSQFHLALKSSKGPVFDFQFFFFTMIHCLWISLCLPS